MALNILRGLFVLLMVAAGYSFVLTDPTGLHAIEGRQWLAPVIAMILGIGAVTIDMLAGRRKLAVFGGVAFGILIGLVITYGLSFAVTLTIDNLLLPDSQGSRFNSIIAGFTTLTLGMVCCFFSVSFILQTRDDFRFIIPYVELRRGTKGSRPVVVDTSALIDGRIADVAATGVLDAQLIVPQFVVRELQLVADNADRAKRARGRRGLDVLAKLKRDPRLDVRVFDDTQGAKPRDLDVDQRLLALARQLDGRALTCDFNLNKVAQVVGVEVINLNDLANALKPRVLPGDTMRVEILHAGSGEGQGVGYLDDGTMVVVEQGGRRLHDEIDVVVTNTTQTSAGRMIFGKPSAADASPVNARAAGVPQEVGAA